MMTNAIWQNRAHNFEQAFGCGDITSDNMKSAIEEWFSLYFASEITDTENPHQRIPFAVVNKLRKTVFSEYKCLCNGKNEFLRSCLGNFNANKDIFLQQALIGGECFIKPIFNKKKSFDYVCVRRDCFVVLGRDMNGMITSIGTAEISAIDKKYYTLLEKRTVDINGYLTIENKLFASYDKSTLGNQIPLSSLAKYEMIQPVIQLPQPVYSLGLIPIKTPLENCVDGGNDSVSMYAAACGLIHSINRNEKQIDDEFENGKSRIVVSSDMMTVDPLGNRSALKDKVFTAVDENIENVGINIFSPALRQESYNQRKQEYLRNIESLIGLKRGILSQVEAAQRTATEITSSDGDYNLTIIDFQKMWSNAVYECARLSLILGKIYNLCSDTQFNQENIILDYGDGVLYNRDKTWAELKEMVSEGILKAEIALGWYFEMPVETEKDLETIRLKYMPLIQEMTGGE